MTYKLYKTVIGQDGAVTINKDGSMTSFIFNHTNTDYQRFKKEVLEGAELQDADGNVMSADAAKEFISTLP